MEKKSFKTDPKLKWISGKARKSALDELSKHRVSGGGLSKREILKAYSAWKRNPDDNIDPGTARHIKRQLEKQLRQHKKEGRTVKEDARRQRTDLSDLREGGGGADRFSDPDPPSSDEPSTRDIKNARDIIPNKPEAYDDPFDDSFDEPHHSHDSSTPENNPDRPSGYDSPRRDGQTSTW